MSGFSKQMRSAAERSCLLLSALQSEFPHSLKSLDQTFVRPKTFLIRLIEPNTISLTTTDDFLRSNKRQKHFAQVRTMRYQSSFFSLIQNKPTTIYRP